MTTLTPLLASVNASPQIDSTHYVVPLLALIGLLMLAVMSRALQQVFTVVVQLVQTAIAVGLAAALVLVLVFSIGFAYAAAR